MAEHELSQAANGHALHPPLHRTLTDWFSGKSTLRGRLLTSVAIALIGSAIISSSYGTDPTFHTDFGMSWFGAKSLIDGVNPYPLVGPGKVYDFEWPLTYPATAMVAILPLGLLTEKSAATIFVALSSGLLAFGLTRRGYYLLPLFATEAFMNSARLGQWSIVLTSALYFPYLGILSCVKAQAALPVLAGSASITTWKWALLGGVSLLAFSLVLLPGWIGDWLAVVRVMEPMHAPVTAIGGFLVLSVLLRWRRPEAWLILVLACVPQSLGWYGVLPLFTVPRSFREAVFLSGFAMVVGHLGLVVLPRFHNVESLRRFVESLIVVSTFLPATLLVLRRPNVRHDLAG